MHEETDSQSTGCGKCGNAKWHFWKDCPARDAECRKCHKKGHFAKKYRSAKSVHDITQGYEDYEEEEFAFLGEVCSKGEEEWIGVLQWNREETAFKLDTGAAVTAIPTSTYSSFDGNLIIQERATKQNVYVVKELSKPLVFQQ